MSKSEKHAQGERKTMTQLQHRHSKVFVGPGAIERCNSNLIAKIESEVLLTQPESPLTGRPVAPTEDSETLLPSEARSLYLWRDEENKDYHLTVIREDRNKVFLDLPLSGVLWGTIKYNINKQWHEVTTSDGKTQHPRRFVFLLKSSTPDRTEVKDFNQKLEEVLKEVLASGNSEEEETNVIAQETSAVQHGASLGRSESLKQKTVVAPGNMAEAPSVAGSSMVNRRSVSKPQAALPAKTAEQMALALAAAIQTGSVKKAQDLAIMLAQGHTNVSVNYDAAAEERKAREQEISVTVHVEDRESAGLTLDNIKVRPSDTVLDIKRSFLGKYGFPVEVQKWIIGKRICGDDETLSKCEVNTSGHTLYLYLLNARAVSLSREDGRRHWQSQASPGAGAGNMTSGSSQRSGQESVYESMYFPIAPPTARAPPTAPQPVTSVDLNMQAQGPPAGPGAMRQQSQHSTASSTPSLAASSIGLSDLRGSVEPASGPSSGQRGVDVRASQGESGGLGQSILTGGGSGVTDQSTLQEPPLVVSLTQEQESVPQGWQCSQCTLINQPTRPGCEACGFPRPSDYQVPSDFIVSDEERQRLEREQQLEAFWQQFQTSGQGWPQNRGQGGATNPPPFTHPSSSSSENEKLTPEQLDLILRFNDAIQEHLSPSSNVSHEGSSVDQQDLLRRGRNSQLVPSGLREPVQNVELGEDVPDRVQVNNFLGWASDDEEESSHA